MLKRLIDHPYFVWVILALPSIPMFSALSSGQTVPNGEPVTEFLLHPTGEFAARFMIISMILTPLWMLFPRSGLVHWMVRRRRYFGVAAFAYAALHTALYVFDMGTLRAILGEFLLLGIWTGWLAMFIFVPLALSSNDYSVRLMGPAWKRLHRAVYVAAVATLLHWMFVHNHFGPALVHFAPLAVLEFYRIWKNLKRRRKQRVV